MFRHVNAGTETLSQLIHDNFDKLIDYFPRYYHWNNLTFVSNINDYMFHRDGFSWIKVDKDIIAIVNVDFEKSCFIFISEPLGKSEHVTHEAIFDVKSGVNISKKSFDKFTNAFFTKNRYLTVKSIYTLVQKCGF